jgi:hypothetical protein
MARGLTVPREGTAVLRAESLALPSPGDREFRAARFRAETVPSPGPSVTADRPAAPLLSKLFETKCQSPAMATGTRIRATR